MALSRWACRAAAPEPPSAACTPHQSVIAACHDVALIKKEREGKGREGKGRKGKERKGKERKGKERRGKDEKGKERLHSLGLST